MKITTKNALDLTSFVAYNVEVMRIRSDLPICMSKIYTRYKIESYSVFIIL